TDYVAVSLKFNDKEWYKVGLRLKGNSSLSSTWGSGIYKLPFRLNFDKFEDDYPQIKNQRFYGFKEFSLSPGYKDNSLIREKVTADIFRMAGIPAAQTAFYKVYIDFGSGLKYCGIYTLTEVVDDSMIKTQFGEGSGNIYKPESTRQTFSATLFEKKNNETANDFTDVQAFVTALNSSVRSSNPAQWRANLEQTFNVDHFVKWLAVNTTLVNWDTYGVMAHNYYFYHHTTNKLTWIPWDNNEALSSRSGPGGGSVALQLSTVGSGWPLIRYVADDATYYAKYKTYVRSFTDDVFTSTKMDALFTKYHTMISPYVMGPEETEVSKYTHLTSGSAFSSELATLKQHVISRKQAVDAFVP
ncbi:MAG: CotH kinase family protein, partial [Cyclobacteriaceae bacterium]|nr:CotH kinase family protein [Cyclobacteriaceae bacterium]